MTCRKSLAIALFLATAASPLAAQAVVTSRKVQLDSAQTTVQRALYRLRDSLKYVDAASERIARDLKSTSNAALVSRARHLAAQCGAAARTAPGTLAVVSATPRPDPDPRGQRGAMEQALRSLAEKMGRCRDDFGRTTAPDQVQELRDYGIGRATRVQQAIRQYEQVLQRYYAEVMGERYKPDFTGAGSIPHAQ